MTIELDSRYRNAVRTAKPKLSDDEEYLNIIGMLSATPSGSASLDEVTEEACNMFGVKVPEEGTIKSKEELANYLMENKSLDDWLEEGTPESFSREDEIREGVTLVEGAHSGLDLPFCRLVKEACEVFSVTTPQGDIVRNREGLIQYLIQNVDSDYLVSED